MRHLPNFVLLFLILLYHSSHGAWSPSAELSQMNAQVHGKVYLDSNNDCSPENETGFCIDCKVALISGANTFETNSDSLGLWSIEVPPGTYQVQATPLDNSVPSCPSINDFVVAENDVLELPLVVGHSDCVNFLTRTDRFQDEITLRSSIVNVENLTTMQFYLRWNPEVVRLDDFSFVLGNSTHYYYNEEEAVLSYSFLGIDGFEVPEDDLIFTGVWNVLSNGDPGFEHYKVEFADVNFAKMCIAKSIEPIVIGGKLSGKVLQDENDDCTYTNESNGYPNAYLKIYNESNSFYRTADADGTYELILPPGDYQIEVKDANALWQNCAEENVTLVENEVVQEDILVKTDSECPLMKIEISTPRLRRCFDNNYYFVEWSNQGSGTAENAYISVALDDALNFVSVSEASAFYQESTHSVILGLGDVPSFASGEFNIRVEVQCEDVELGQTHCTTAYIYPNTPCVVDEQWSGAELAIEARCEDENVIFKITNIGAGAMIEQSNFIVIEDEVMYQQPDILLAPGEEEEFQFAANGSTYIGIVGQANNHPYGEMISDAIELCGTNDSGTASLGYITMYSTLDDSPHVDKNCTENIGSYDPNDKQAWPKGYAGTNLIENYVSLDYMIRFQNTGTDTAFNIVVKDTLSEFLDLSSLRIGPSSHDFSFNIEDERTLVWRFDNILLPDSTTNEEASNGFVKFSIDQIAGNEDGTIIDNSASIYFDYNEPILTNTVRREIGSNFVQIGVSTIEQDLVSMQVYPNPAKDRLLIEYEDAIAELQYRILTQHAQEVYRGNIISDQIEIADVRQGVYILEIVEEERVLARRKIVVIR